MPQTLFFPGRDDTLDLVLDIKIPFIIFIFLTLQFYSYKVPFQKIQSSALLKNTILGLFNFAVIWNLQKVIGLYLNITPPTAVYFSPIKTILIILSFDLLSYAWHRANHTFEFLWKWHKFHHTPEVIETSTALRFHTIEILLSWPLKATLATLLGASAMDLMIFEILFQANNLFQHSNFQIPKKLDQTLSKIFITPSQHRLHHSVVAEDQHKNLSTIFNFWDKLFKTQKLNLDEQITKMGLNPSQI